MGLRLLWHNEGTKTSKNEKVNKLTFFIKFGLGNKNREN